MKLKLLILLVVVGMFWVGKVYAYTLPDGDLIIKELYQMENLNAATGTDSLTNSGGITFTSGKFVNAMTDGGSDMLTYASTSLTNAQFNGYCLNSPDTIASTTLNFWFKYNSGGASSYLTTETNGQSNDLYIDYNNNLAGQLFFHGSGLSASYSWSNNTSWNMLTAEIVPVNNGNGDRYLRLYLNGTQVATSSQSNVGGLHCSSDFGGYRVFQTIGAGFNSTANSPINGQIDNYAVIVGRNLTDVEIAALWNGGTGQELDVGGGAGISDQVNFIYPENMLTTPDFLNWFVNLQDQGGLPGNLLIKYGQSTSSLDFVDHQQVAFDTSFFNNATTGIISGNFSIKKSILLNPIINLKATSTWYAYAEFQTQDGVVDVKSNTIKFIIDPQASVAISSSTQSAGVNFFQQQIFSSSTSQWEICGLSHLDGCLINSFNWVFQQLVQPHQVIKDQLRYEFDNIKAVFPFSLANAVVQSVSSSTTGTSYGQSLSIEYLNNTETATSSYTLISPTFLKDMMTTKVCSAGCAQDKKDNIFNIITAVLWAGGGFIALKLL